MNQATVDPREVLDSMREIIKDNVEDSELEMFNDVIDIAKKSIDDCVYLRNHNFNDKKYIKIKETLKNYIFLLKAISEATPGQRVYQASEVIAIIDLIAKEIFDGKQMWDGTVKDE